MRQALRTFRVDRIREITPLEECFTPPRGFSLRDYLERWMSFEPVYRVMVRLDVNVAPRARERHGDWMEFTDGTDGGTIARFGVANLDWATGWVLGYGGAAEVLEPPELIARVREAAAGALRRYETGCP